MKTKKDIKSRNLFELFTKFDLGFNDAHALQRLARSLHRSYENDCSYGLTERQEKRERKLWSQVQAIADDNGIYVREQGDPRGWPIIISKNPIHEADTFSLDRVCPY